MKCVCEREKESERQRWGDKAEGDREYKEETVHGHTCITGIQVYVYTQEEIHRPRM